MWRVTAQHLNGSVDVYDVCLTCNAMNYINSLLHTTGIASVSVKWIVPPVEDYCAKV